MTHQAEASIIRLATPHFILRTVEAEDVSARWGEWTADPVKARSINARPRAIGVEEWQRYVASFDRRSGHLLGIFPRASGDMIGFWSVYVDWDYKEFLINVLIGERGRQNLLARNETQEALLRYFFDELHLESMRCNVLASNRYVAERLLLRSGAVIEHTSKVGSASGEGTTEIQHFRGTREAWTRLRDKLDAARATSI